MLQRLRDSEVTPEMAAFAIRQRDAVARWENLGKEYPAIFDDVTIVARVERHFHPPGGPLRPWGPHPGISLLRVVQGPNEQPPLRSFELGTRSRKNLEGVHPDLVKVLEYAIHHTPLDFTVIEGLRSLKRQRELVKSGASQTLQSRHLTGHAVDVAPWVGGTVSWSWEHFNVLGPTVLAAAKTLQIALEWGGNWTGFRDGPHFQLPRKDYP
jgi:hypothetical protein